MADVEGQSVEGVERGRKDERQRQERTQNVRLVTDRDYVVHVHLHTGVNVVITGGLCNS